jgi:hypothetical protein
MLSPGRVAALVACRKPLSEGESQVVWFEAQDYEADKKRRLGTDADQPHRIKYKPLVRR